MIFAGTPEFAAQSLSSLIAAGFEIKAVLSQPDKPSGRGRKVTHSPVKQMAVEHQIPALQPERLTESFIQSELTPLAADVMVVVAYGLIIPPSLLKLPRLGCINLHASLLPRWRGAAPIQRAIEAGDPYTGVCVMQMEAGLDTGPTLSRTAIAIGAQDTSAQLHDKLAQAGAKLLVHTMTHGLSQRAIQQRPQEARYAQKLQKSEGMLDWHLSAETLIRKIQAFNPWPVCYSEFQGAQDAKPTRLRIWAATLKPEPKNPQLPGQVVASCATHGIDVQTGHGIVSITQAQLPGTKPMHVRELINGHGEKFRVGTRIG